MAVFAEEKSSWATTGQDFFVSFKPESSRPALSRPVVRDRGRAVRAGRRHHPRVPTPRIPPADWTDPRHRLGWEAEVVAGKWLEGRGYVVEAHRWRLGRHDLDLIARRGGVVAFIEVKVRRTDRCGAGEEAVGYRKRRAIERAAWAWILRYGRAGDQYRFDLISLAGPGPGALTVNHIEDAWRPGWR